MKKKIFRIALILSICLSMVPSDYARAVELNNIGESECNHEHTEDCYVSSINCIHVHDENCYSDKILPLENEDKEADTCIHECTKDTGCVTEILDCSHIHDENCGYESQASSTEDATNQEKTERDLWIENELRKLEDQYNNGAPMTMSFVQGFIPWDNHFTVSGLPNSSGITKEQWLQDCKKVSPAGYNVDNTGVKYTKFPQYDSEGIHFNNVTVNGVEVVRAGILEPDTGVGDPVYYYMTQKHVDSDSNDGSGSHTGSISALVLPEGSTFQVNYAVNEYKLTYEVQVDGKDVTNDKFDLNDENSVTWEQTIFAGQNPASTNNGAASFPVTIPYGYTARVYMEREGYNGETELTGSRPDLNGDPEQESKIINEGYPLGTEPEYEHYTFYENNKKIEEGVRFKTNDSNSPTAERISPTAKRMSAIFYSDLVQENRHIIVKLVEDKEDEQPIFDAHYWLKTDNAGGDGTGRGSSAKMVEKKDDQGNIIHDDQGNIIYEPDLSSGGRGNIGTADGWGWKNSVFNEDPRKYSAKEEYEKYWHQESDGTWSLTWAFQTNSGDWILNSLELNGEFIDIPFRPIYIWNDGDGDVDNPELGGTSTTTTTLSNGAKVELTFYRRFGRTQRVYILKITGARSNITVTNGNLMDYNNGAPEYVAIAMQGVTATNDGTDTFGYYDTKLNDWAIQPKASVQVQYKDNNGIVYGTDFDGDPDYKYANLRFKLQTGYENPFFIWEDRVTGDVLESSQDPDGQAITPTPWAKAPETLEKNKIYGPDNEGWYYIRIENEPGKNGHKMCVLTLNATAMKYMVRYMVGKPGESYTNAPLETDGNVQNMPTFSPDDSDWDNEILDGIEGSYPERYDDNGGSFYDRQSTPTISVSDKIPTTKDGKKFFQYWVLVDENEEIINGEDGKPIIVNPNGTITLSQFAEHGVPLDSEIGGTNFNYYVIRLKGVWSDTPTDFKFYIRMVWTDQETGQSHVMDLVQNVTTSATDGNMTEDGCLTVSVNTLTDTFKNWFKLHPFYAYAARNFIPTAERSKDSFTENGIVWEKYPTDFTEGSTEQKVPNSDAYYRIEKQEDIVKYVVQREGTIVLYLDPVNGRLPIAKTINGSNPGDDTFTYEITAHLLQEDIDRNNSDGSDFLTAESLKNMLPSGTYLGQIPDATMTDLKDFDGTDVVLHFSRNISSDDMSNVSSDDMKEWSSTATFTLKGGEATVLGLPQGKYTIKEINNDKQLVFAYDVNINGSKSNDYTFEQEVRVGNVTPSVKFENTVKPVDYTLNLKKEIVGLNGDEVPESAQNANFGFELSLTSGDSKSVSIDNSKTSIQTSKGKGNGEFEKITFKHTGTYTFLVTETGYDKDSYYPAPRSHSVTVEVDNVNGQLNISKVIVDKTVYDNVEKAEVLFTNTYIGNIEDAIVLPEVTKVLKGRSTLPAGMFMFEISATEPEKEGMTLPENITATNGNGADGSVVFDPITFSRAGEYTVSIEEKNDGITGIDYDSSKVFITYKVEEVNDSLKVTSTTYKDGNDTFENQAFANAEFNVIKNYDVSKRPGQSWENDTFTITAKLIEASGDVKYKGVLLDIDDIAELTLNNANQTGKFDFRFDNEGTYIFEVRETNGGLPGVSYDSSIYYVKVTVTANGEQMVSAVSITKNDKVVTDNTVTFDNKFNPDNIDVIINANKVLKDENGHSIDLAARRFRFQLVSKDSQTSGIISSNDANGNITFTLTNLSVDEYEYVLRELDDEEAGISYDTTEYIVHISVVRERTNTPPTYTVTYTKQGTTQGSSIPPTFENSIKSYGQLAINNTVTGDGADPTKEFTYTINFDGVDKNETFRYELQSNDGTSNLVRRVNDGYIVPLFAPNSVAMTGMIKSGQSIQLRHGQTVVIYGIPTGTKYTIEESDYGNYKVSHDGTNSVKATGTITNDGIQVNYVNTLKLNGPDVHITKTQSVNGNTKDILTVNEGDIVTYTMTVTNKGDTIAENVTITDKVPTGLIVDTINDNGIESDGTITWNIGELDINASQTVSFTVRVPTIAKNQNWSNTANVVWDGETTGKTSNFVTINAVYTSPVPTGNLVVTNKVTGNAGENDRVFHFEVTIGNETFKFSLKGGESWTSEQFPANTPYSIKVIDANKNGYTTTIPDNASGVISGGHTINVEFINHKDNIDTDSKKKPINSSVETQPQTGDINQIELWTMLCSLSLIGLILVVYRTRKKNYR